MYHNDEVIFCGFEVGRANRLPRRDEVAFTTGLIMPLAPGMPRCLWCLKCVGVSHACHVGGFYDKMPMVLQVLAKEKGLWNQSVNGG